MIRALSGFTSVQRRNSSLNYSNQLRDERGINNNHPTTTPNSSSLPRTFAPKRRIAGNFGGDAVVRTTIRHLSTIRWRPKVAGQQESTIGLSGTKPSKTNTIAPHEPISFEGTNLFIWPSRGVADWASNPRVALGGQRKQPQELTSGALPVGHYGCQR